MDTLRVSLFGTVRVERIRVANGPESLHLSLKVQALLAWLLIHPPHPHPRERIADDLWGDQGPDRAQGSLSTTLWRLRQILEPDDTCPRGSWILCGPGDLGLNWESPVWVDVLALETSASHALSQAPADLETDEADALEAALCLCSADLLDGYYADWVLRRRESLRRTHLNGLAHLMRYHQHAGRLERAAHFAHRLLEIDPLREEIHRALITLYARMGQTPDALRQYELCASILAHEMGIPPMPETIEVHRRLVMGEPLSDAGTAAPIAASSAAGYDSSAATILQELRAALDACDQARRRVQSALDLLDLTFLKRPR